MIRRTLRLEAFKERPFELWNLFVDLVAKENYIDLNAVQRIAHLAFWYDSEVQNGGHLQYFENRGLGELDETSAALLELGADCQHRVLRQAGRVFASKPREHIENAAQYVATALCGEYDALDSAYYACNPGIQQLLMDYLTLYRDQFVEILE